MKKRYQVIGSVICGLLMMAVLPALSARRGEELASERDDWKKSFSVSANDFAVTGRNRFFILEPGYRLTLKGTEDGVEEVVVITVLNETKVVDGVVTRIVEERETKNGALIEVSRNFFAIDRKTNDVYYFGESVDMYRNGRVTHHEGEWMSGQNGARYGLAMPARPKVGQKYYQEIAPDAAMDRAEIKSLQVSFQTPAGKFKNCVKVDETSPMEPGEHSIKIYAPGIGLIKDGVTRLVQHGFVTL